MAKQIVARISDELHLKVKLKAVREGKSITQVVSELLEEWVGDDSSGEAEDVSQVGYGLG